MPSAKAAKASGTSAIISRVFRSTKALRHISPPLRDVDPKKDALQGPKKIAGTK